MLQNQMGNLKYSMDKNALQNSILTLLKTSTISDHNKKMIMTLLPVMEESELNDIHNALSEEKSKMEKLEDKKKRITLKYQVMVEKMNKMKTEK